MADTSLYKQTTSHYSQSLAQKKKKKKKKKKSCYAHSQQTGEMGYNPVKL